MQPNLHKGSALLLACHLDLTGQTPSGANMLGIDLTVHQQLDMVSDSNSHECLQNVMGPWAQAASGFGFLAKDSRLCFMRLALLPRTTCKQLQMRIIPPQLIIIISSPSSSHMQHHLAIIIVMASDMDEHATCKSSCCWRWKRSLWQAFMLHADEVQMMPCTLRSICC